MILQTFKNEEDAQKQMEEHFERNKGRTPTRKDYLELENLIVGLLNNTDYFYGYFLQEVERRIDFTIPSVAGVGFRGNKIVLFWNPTYASLFQGNQIKHEILKHEIFHLMNDHLERGKAYQVEDANPIKQMIERNDINVCMDLAINQQGLDTIYNAEILFEDSNTRRPMFVNIDSYAERYELNKKDVKPNETFEYYYALAKKQRQDGKGKGGEESYQIIMLDDHSLSEGEKGTDSEGNPIPGLSESIKREIIAKMAKKAKNRAGNVSGHVASAVDRLQKSLVNWKSELKRFPQQVMNAIYKKTRTRTNRRYGIMWPGKTPEFQCEIAFIVDTSGSMSDDSLSQAWTELLKILDIYPNMKIHLIEADSDVKEVREFNKKCKAEFKGRGGTAYQPAIDKAMELKPNAIIYYGDMDSSDKPENPKIPFLWLVNGDQDPPGNFGRVVRIPHI